MKPNSLLPFILALLSSVCSIANPIEVNDDFESTFLEKKIRYTKDFKEDSYFDFNYIKSLKFENIGIIPSNTTGAYWIEIPIENKLNSTADLTIETNRFQNLELYYFRENKTLASVKSGITHPFSKRDLVKGDISILPFTIPPKSKTSVYLWVSQPEKSPYQYSVSHLTLKNKSTTIKDLSNAENILYFFLGAIILMTLYNLALFMVVRKSGYLYYIANNVFIILFVLAQVGKIDTYFFDSPKYHEKTILILGNISFIFYMLFSKEVLKFKKYDPKWNTIVNYSLIVWPTLLLFVFLDLEKVAVAIGSLGAFTGYYIIIHSCIKAIRKGSISIKYFLGGNIFYFSAVIIQILQINGVLPHQIGSFTSIEFVEVGTMIQLALFSLTLGSSINIIKRKLLEKEVEQQRQRQYEQIRLSTMIRQKNKELEKKVSLRTAELKENSVLLKRRNTDINNSLNYARRIQNAFLPDKDVWDKILPNSFFIYQPKEVISGDFYWVAEMDNKKFFAVADCTGHGIPGAMVSVIAVNNLQRCISEYQLEKPNKILDKLNSLVEESFESKHNKEAIKDGMDIAICCIYQEGNKTILEYSGANNPLWIFRNQKLPPISNTKRSTSTNEDLTLYELAPNKQPIGKHLEKAAFNLQKLELFKTDEIYLFTDGIIDQFGGPKNKKFKSNNLRQLLTEVNGLDNTEKKNRIQNAFRKWKNKEEQVDDVCLASIRI